jgi:MFS family permease
MIHTDPYLRGGAGVRVLLVFAAAYVLSYALRAINAVIAPALTQDLLLSNADLGLLSSAYFVGFGCMQLPVGIWLDKYGARRTESTLLLFAALGCALFATSESLVGLWLGRALIGAGVSSCLMAAMKAFRVWFHPRQQSQLASGMLVFGTLGALSTTVPVAMVLPTLGWRGIFWLMALLLLLAALLVFQRLKNVEQQMAAVLEASTPAPSQAVGYLSIFRDPYFRRMALLGAIFQGGFMALQSLWAGPWMIRVLGFSITQTSQILFVFNACLMLCYMVLSWWAPRHVSYGHPSSASGQTPVLRAVTVGLLAALALQVLMVWLPYRWSWVLWIGYAGLATVTTLAQTHVSLAFPAKLAGRANGAFNLTLFIGAFGIQWGLGGLVDLFSQLGYSDAAALRWSFSAFLLLQLLALLAFIASKSFDAPHLDTVATQ